MKVTGIDIYTNASYHCLIVNAEFSSLNKDPNTQIDIKSTDKKFIKEKARLLTVTNLDFVEKRSFCKSLKSSTFHLRPYLKEQIKALIDHFE